MIACEPAARAPLAAALRDGLPAISVPEAPTQALSIGTTVGSYRGVLAIRSTNGRSITLTDRQLHRARDALSREGIWQELSGAAGVAGLRELVEQGEGISGPVVCLATSSGFKDADSATGHPEPSFPVVTCWADIRRELARAPGSG